MKNPEDELLAQIDSLQGSLSETITQGVQLRFALEKAANRFAYLGKNAHSNEARRAIRRWDKFSTATPPSGNAHGGEGEK